MPRIAIAMRDFDAAVELFRDAFGMPVVDFSDRTVPTLGAHVGMCMPVGGSNIELMAPSDPDQPLSQSLLKFLDRRGDGLYALMLEAPDPDREAEDLSGRGVEVLPLMRGAGGRDIHPRSTHGVLIRVYPNDSVKHDGERTSAAPNLSGIARVIIATPDAGEAARAYGPGGLGLAVAPLATDAERGVEVVVVQPPKGGVIELVSPVDLDRSFAQDIEEFLRTRGAGMYALVLETADRAQAMAMLRERGLAFSGPPGSEAVSVFGARLLIEST